MNRIPQKFQVAQLQELLLMIQDLLKHLASENNCFVQIVAVLKELEIWAKRNSELRPFIFEYVEDLIGSNRTTTRYDDIFAIIDQIELPATENTNAVNETTSIETSANGCTQLIDKNNSIENTKSSNRSGSGSGKSKRRQNVGTNSQQSTGSNSSIGIRYPDKNEDIPNKRKCRKIHNKRSVDITLTNYSDVQSNLNNNNSVDYSNETHSTITDYDHLEMEMDLQDYFSDISEENDSDFHTETMDGHD